MAVGVAMRNSLILGKGLPEKAMTERCWRGRLERVKGIEPSS